MRADLHAPSHPGWHPGLIPYSDEAFEEAKRVHRISRLLRAPGLGPMVLERLAAVTVDTINNGNSATSGTTVDGTIVVGNNANRAILALCGSDSSGNHVSTMAYTAGSGGAPALVTGTKTANGGRESEIWISLAPSVGSITLRMTMTSAIAGDAVMILYSLYSVDQTTPTSAGGQAGVVVTKGVATDADSRALWLIVSPGGGGTYSGAASAFDKQVSVSAIYESLGAAGNGGTQTLNWTSSSRAVSVVNVKAAASSAKSQHYSYLS